MGVLDRPFNVSQALLALAEPKELDLACGFRLKRASALLVIRCLTRLKEEDSTLSEIKAEHGYQQLERHDFEARL